MAAAKRARAPVGPTSVEALTHEQKRSNIPTADAHAFVSPEVDAPQRLLYPRDPSLDPQLVWKGKDEQDAGDLAVAAPPVYIQEKIDPRVLVENLRRTAARSEDEPELTLFDSFDGLGDYETVEFYKHAANWSNRMVLGDSLEVMASLAEREDLRGKVQMIYLDPPYGIKFGSNWQVSTRKRDVKDGKLEDATREVEQIKAFRDTWELGIHSYLSYLRDRLVVARDLLTESGSIFVQISDENVHLVRCLLDEVLGPDCQVATIAIAKASPETRVIRNNFNYVLWYCKDIARIKSRKLFRDRNPREGSTEDPAKLALRVELPDGSERAMTQDEKRSPQLLPQGSRIFRMDKVVDAGEDPLRRFRLSVDAQEVEPKGGFFWRGDRAEMARLLAANRVGLTPEGAGYKFFLNDYPLVEWGSYWHDTAGKVVDMTYVVQTNAKVIERCILMTTDPGDLVLDPTCGSGTTAYVAEQWGRRWITVDTSRVAIALARQRLMGAKLPSYLLSDSPEGQAKEAQLSGTKPTGETKRDVRKGFVYERVPHVTLKSIANNPDIREGLTREEIDAAIARHAETEVLYDRPYEDKRKVRVAGPFTVESLSPHRAMSWEQEAPATERATRQAADASTYEKTILENLRTAGVQNGRRKERLEFEDVEPFAGKYVQAVGVRSGAQEGTPQRVAIALGPEYGTVSPQLVKEAAREALRGQGHDLLLVLGFAFDALALETVEEFRPSEGGDFASVAGERRMGRLPVLLVRMNPDLAMGNELLKKTKAGNLFMVFGEPDIAVAETAEGCVVEIRGVDVYDPTTGEVRSNNPDEIALWMVDSDYNGESFFVRHCYFSGGGTDPYSRLKRALKADIDEAAWSTLYGTRSRPFAKPATGRIAVKAINHYGDEVLKIIEV